MYLPRLYPEPQKNTSADGAYVFGAAVTMRVPRTLSRELCENMRFLWERFTFTASALTIVPDDIEYLAIGEAEKPTERGYFSIKVTDRGAALASEGDKALMDGFTTLVQLIIPHDLSRGNERFSMPALSIADNPSLNLRMIHLCIFPESKLSTIEKAIVMAGFLKFTHVILEFWGMYKYKANSALAWEHAYTKAQIKPLVELAHGYGMEVIPMLNHFGHASQSRGGAGRHTILDQDPRMQLLFEPDGWTWCVSNPDTLALLEEMRGELIDLCGEGSYFHLGFDEADSFATCPICRKRVPHELVAEYVNGLTDKLMKDGRRPIIWHDMFIDRRDFPGLPYHLEANGQIRNTAPAIDLLDRRILIADWEYNIKTPDVPETDSFLSRGFDVVLCPWDDYANVSSLSNVARKKNCSGIMLTTWHHLPDYIPRMLRFCDYIWNGGDKSSPVQSMESAAILRKLRPAVGFADAGWRIVEAENDR